MTIFRDSRGDPWNLVLTIGRAIRIRDRLGIDLTQPESGEPPVLSRLATDEILLGETICVLIEDQLEARKISPRAALELFDGATVAAAQKAFFDELVIFFRQRGRTDRAKAVLGIVEAMVRIVTDAEACVDRATSGLTSGGSPEPSGSTPAP